MTRPKKISAIMHKLLIEEKMDAFSVIEARNVLLKSGEKPSASDELRKQIYRQVSLFEKHGWLKSEGTGRQKRFYVTDKFRQQPVRYKTRPQQEKVTYSSDDYSILIKERNEYEGELKIVLGEIDEYRSLLSRFPALKQNIDPLLQASKTRSAELLGKVNGLTNVLRSLVSKGAAC